MALYPRNVEDLLVDLKFVGMTEPGQKINFNSQNTVSSTSPVGPFIRWWNREDKNDMIDKLSSIMKEAGKILEDADCRKYHVDIISELIKVDIAFGYLIDVYRSYNKTVSKLEMFKRRIEVIIDASDLETKSEVKVILEKSGFDLSKSRFVFPKEEFKPTKSVSIKKKDD